MSELVDRLREVPDRVAERVARASDQALRRRPALGEWSAIEVVGHLTDKLEIWRARVERTATEENPTLDPYDQDELVRRVNYHAAELDGLLAALRAAAERFATVTAGLDRASLDRPCRHGEYGAITLRQCITLPLESVDEHLAQIDGAMDAGTA